MKTLIAVFTLAGASLAFAADRTAHTSSGFQGPKANTGKALHLYEGN